MVGKCQVQRLAHESILKGTWCNKFERGWGEEADPTEKTEVKRKQPLMTPPMDKWDAPGKTVTSPGLVRGLELLEFLTGARTLIFVESPAQTGPC